MQPKNVQIKLRTPSKQLKVHSPFSRYAYEGIEKLSASEFNEIHNMNSPNTEMYEIKLYTNAS